MLTAIIGITLLSGPQPPLHCVNTHFLINGPPGVAMEYGGTVFGTCCGDCDKPFMKDPKALIARAVKARKAIGAFEYDPITGLRIAGATSAAFSDYRAIRYYFTSEEEKKAFDSKPGKFVQDVKSEAYFCPVMNHATASMTAGAYADYHGTRYFLCCGDCAKTFKASPARFAANAAAAVKDLVPVRLTK